MVDVKVTIASIPRYILCSLLKFKIISNRCFSIIKFEKSKIPILNEKLLCFFSKSDKKNFYNYRKTSLLVPGVIPFSNANFFVWDQFIKENKTDFKISTCLLLNLVLY
jgi:hypothetical protein